MAKKKPAAAARAATRVKTGESKPVDGIRDKSHLTSIAAGESVEDVDLPASALVRSRGESVIDPDDNESYAGMEAARESLMLRPDNPNRPADVEGEAAWKVAKGTAFGSETASVHATGQVLPGEERTQIATTEPSDAQKAIEEANAAAIEAEVAEREAEQKRKDDAQKAAEKRAAE